MPKKKIVEMFIRIQELQYYDRIMLLIRAKFTEIVKVGDAIEDGIKTRKISLVSSLTEYVGLLKKKREDVSSISYALDGKGHFRKSSTYKCYPRDQQNSYLVCYTQPSCQTPAPN